MQSNFEIVFFIFINFYRKECYFLKNFYSELMLYSDFVKCVNHFLQISDRINDGWTLEKYNDRVYLTKYMTQWLENKDNESINDLNELDELKLNELNLNLEEDEQSANNLPLKFRKWQYHIIHSLSYQVPVIYFNVWKSNGQLLSLDELWNAVNPCFKEQVAQNKWYTLTQQEHPYLFKPFFYFHPCHTEAFLNDFGNPKCNVLITWLSSIGQVIWLNLDLSYGKMCCF